MSTLGSGIQLWHGDCLELMHDIPVHSVDAVICDLPYGTTSNKWDVPLPFKDLWEAYDRVCKHEAAICLFGSQPFSSLLVSSNLNMFRHEWIWIKNRGSNFANTVREPFKEHEHILVFSKGSWTYNKQMQTRTGGGLSRVQYTFKTIPKSSNYRAFSKVSGTHEDLRVPSSWQKFNTEVGLHPTQKPVVLLEYLINTYSNEGDLILDNTAGSMSTAIAAINTNRRCICIEKDDHYFAVGSARVREHLSAPRLF